MNIPTDWSKISDEEALKYIAYLDKHSYKYKITMDENNIIHIGNVANIAYTYNKAMECSAIKINNKHFFAEFDCLCPFDKAYDLYSKMQHKLLPFKTKAKEWWENYYDKVLIATMLTCVMGGILVGTKIISNNSKRSKEQFKQEIINEALERFKQEQQKNNSTIQYPIQKSK